jgi:hypothetical protein
VTRVLFSPHTGYSQEDVFTVERVTVHLERHIMPVDSVFSPQTISLLDGWKHLRPTKQRIARRFGKAATHRRNTQPNAPNA